MDGLMRRLCEICGGGNVFVNEPMKRRTYYKIGGCADYYVTPPNVNAFISCLSLCGENDVNKLIVGNCSNLLVRDGGIRGVVLSTERLNEITVSGGMITAGAGATLGRLAATAYENALSGLAFAHGIPGSVGGGVYMNAGAYGGEIKDVFKSAAVIRNGSIIDVSAADMGFGYRESALRRTEDVIVSASFVLKHGEKAAIKAEMDELAKRRRDKQPLDMPSCGSVFKRPENDFAGRLIEDAGLKGFSVGGAAVSPKHCGFIVNTGNASCSDVLNIIKHIKETVFINFGVTLEEEVRVVGEEVPR